MEHHDKKVVILPHTADRLREKLGQALTANELNIALKYAKQLYELTPDFSTNLAYAGLLVDFGHSDQAFSLMKPYEDQYLAEWETRELYVNLLIEQRHFLKAQNLIQESLKQELSPEKQQLWEAYAKRCELAMDQASEEEARQELSISALDDYLKQLPENSSKQFQFIKQYLLRYPEEMQRRAQELFDHPHLVKLTKATVLQLLVERQVDETYRFPWLDTVITVNPRDLAPLHASKALDVIDDTLRKWLADDPTQEKLLMNEVMFQCLHLYPKIDETIMHPILWLKVVLDRSGLFSKSYIEDWEDPEVQVVLKYLNKIEEYPLNEE